MGRSPYGGWRHFVEALIEVSAADGSTGQCWSTTGLVAREIFHNDELDKETKARLAHELLYEGRRLVASNAETGASGRVVGRRVPGGVVVSGVKTFNSNSGGGGRDLSCVSFALLGEDGDTAAAPRHHALIRLDDPALELGHDWDNMGQRGTYSQTITYRDVFVPDGWHFPSHGLTPYFVGSALQLHGALLQGIGEGALAAAIAYLRELNRPSMPSFPSAAEDPLMHRQIGEMSSELAASRALLLATAAELDHPELIDPAEEVMVRGFRAKVAGTRAGLDVTARIFDLTGARSTANKYRFDRFWRNARTFGSHDSLDAKNAFIGAAELTGTVPPLSAYMRA
ncbi:acyl-CoA dehydrogenase family protein [Thermocatellispora tengchongensis]|uniref:acyl-CoA dehydrogenase family protein n=1 Tax=Thermocatellispora tengchongensis TaxID=1073253 RepID=UPI00363BD66A